MMITCIAFNPCDMDYTSWLTISGFEVAILLFYMNVVSQNLSVRKNRYFIRPYKRLGYTFGFVTIVTIVGILSFIFALDCLGAILITSVLFVLLVSPVIIISISHGIRDSYDKEEEINRLRSEFHPELILDDIESYD